MKRILFGWIAILIPSLTLADAGPVLYLDRQFSVHVRKDVRFGTALIHYPVKGLITLHCDLHEPANPDPTAEMPCVLFIHGNSGGAETQLRDLGTDLASRGYVFVSAAIRASNSLGPGQRVLDCSAEDIRSVMQWIVTNAKMLRIDTKQIFIGGFSGDATQVLEAVYHGKGLKNVRGVLAYWGHFRYRDPVRKKSPPLLIVHGLNDPVIPVMEARIAGALAEKAGATTELILPDLDSHGFSFKTVYDGRDIYRITAEFCHRHLK